MTLIDPRSIDLLRYLLVMRLDKSLVLMSKYPALEMAHVCSVMIAERLPTSQIKPWRRLLTAWEEANPPEQHKGPGTFLNPPEADWPLDMAWLPYRIKETYGQGEVLCCELKLFGSSAAHEVFLEMFLPVLEEIGVRADSRWSRPGSLWGRYHLEGVHVARGKQWEPFVENGRIDFSCRPGPRQWTEGLDLGEGATRAYRRLQWRTPYAPASPIVPQKNESAGMSARRNAPDLAELVQALSDRLSVVVHGWEDTVEQEELKRHLQEAAAGISCAHDEVHAPPKYWPGQVWGEQAFSAIPPLLVPELELASILHVGRHTHVGCGTFHLS